MRLEPEEESARQRSEHQLRPARRARRLDALRAGATAALLLVGPTWAEPVRAGETDIPIPLCFEPAAAGTVRARATDGGRFQVIPPGGLDDQPEYFVEATVRPREIVKLSGVQFQQYVEILAVEPDGVMVRSAGWARSLGEFERRRRLPHGCRAPSGDPAPRTRLTYAGIGLASDLDHVAAAFPNSRRAGDYIYVDRRDVRDHVTGIELSRVRARLSFGRPAMAGVPAGKEAFPSCEQVQTLIAAHHGAPDVVEAFAEERQRRSDRQWLRSGERLTLQCFAGADGGWVAEAVVIAPAHQAR